MVRGKRTHELDDSERLSQLPFMDHCVLCFRRCGVDRRTGSTGPCHAGLVPRISACVQHKGEEPPLCGDKGSGAIFFSGCSLRCVYCQNYRISQLLLGEELSVMGLAQLMNDLQDRGSHNINLVSPTHYVPQILAALTIAKQAGLTIPVVYNSHGFDSTETVSLLEGAIDVYLPDLKYSDDGNARRLSGVEGYTKASREAITSMFHQVGHLEIDSNTGLAKKGLLVRILVLPGGLAGVRESLQFLKECCSARLAISLMAQYHPMYEASHFPPLHRTVTPSEYEEVLDFATELGFEEMWIQDLKSAETGIPDFSSDTPFNFQ